MLRIANPKAGTDTFSVIKSSVQVITRILSEAGSKAAVRFTRRPPHAMQILVEYGIDGLSSFAFVASTEDDGILHRVLDGLSTEFLSTSMATSDWSIAPSITIQHADQVMPSR